MDILIAGNRSEIAMSIDRYKESSHHLKLRSAVFALIVIVVALRIIESPEIRREGIDVEPVVEPVTLLWENIVASDSYHQECFRRNVAVERSIRLFQSAVRAVGGVECRSHQADAEASVSGVMRTTDDAEVYLLVWLRLVRLCKVLQQSRHESMLCFYSVSIICSLVSCFHCCRSSIIACTDVHICRRAILCIGRDTSVKYYDECGE